MKPPLGSNEVDVLKKSLENKEYRYKCKDEPIVVFVMLKNVQQKNLV